MKSFNCVLCSTRRIHYVHDSRRRILSALSHISYFSEAKQKTTERKSNKYLKDPTPQLPQQLPQQTHTHTNTDTLSLSFSVYLSLSLFYIYILLIMEAVQNLAPYQQQEFMKHLEQMQLKDSLAYVFIQIIDMRAQRKKNKPIKKERNCMTFS